MNENPRVGTPPQKPLLVYDGDCRFCALWIKRWEQAAGNAVEFIPFQDASVSERFPEIPRSQFETAVQLIETNGRVYSGADAALRARACNPRKRWLLRCYNASPSFASTSEKVYRFVAGHRSAFSALTRIAYGNHVEQPPHLLVRWTFLRSLALIYFIAFVSLWSQVGGLIGINGILPAEQFMGNMAQQSTAQGMGIERFWLLPTLCWINAGDGFLNAMCASGVVLSMLLLAGVAPRLALVLLWLLYLSLSVVGQAFLSFQWDTLLLETGFFAIFYAPRQWLPGLSRESPPSRLSIWLLRWLLFRLMFQSGVTKLLYDDPTWLNLTALTLHYETQPLPTWIGWHAHQLPLWFQQLSCALMYLGEIVVPFFFFAPRRLRFAAAAATVFLMALIGLTGNYNFFNLLTIVLCLPLLDDAVLQKYAPTALRRFLRSNEARPMRATSTPWKTWLAGVFATAVILITTVQMMFNCRKDVAWPKPVMQLTMAVAPLRTLNSYGLFRVMTPSRPEIIVEGSNDGATWLPYEFKYKAGRLDRRPGFVEPHQPRLDWQMWFEALRPSGSGVSPWFANFCIRLMQGSDDVLELMETNPFPEGPPRFVRAVMYEYQFTDPAERNHTGNWWRRELKGVYLPVVSLRGQN